MGDQVKYEDVVTPEEELMDEMGEEEETPTAPMSKDERQTEAARLIQSAISYQESDMAPHREQATNYYYGRPLGDEEEGRSQVVSTELKDTVDALMPSFMRLFFGPDRVVEFNPRTPDKAKAARQATEFVNFVIEHDNRGVIEIHNVIKDALLRRGGVIKYLWDDTVKIENHEFSGITEEQLYLLEADEDVEYNITESREYTDPRAVVAYAQQQKQYDQLLASGQSPAQMGMQPPQPPQPTQCYDVEVKRYNRDGICKFAAVPPEEFIYSPDARSMEDAIMVGQRQEKTLSDLRAMGVPESVLTEIDTGSKQRGTGPSVTELGSTPDALARNPGGNLPTNDASGPNRKYMYYEIYIYMDVDNDGISEHRKMVLVGTSPKLVWDEPAPDRPFAMFEVDPEPHQMQGMDVADRTLDLQLSKTKVLRGSLDSLAFSLHPRTVAVEGQASIADIMNTEIGAVIRERNPNMVRTLDHEFVGQYSLPFLTYFDDMKAARVGVAKGAVGLDPDALQSSTQTAVAASVSGAQQRLELYARMLAETGMKQLMRGLLRLLVRHQSKARMVRLNNQFVEVDPRAWDADMDVTINVAVGHTLAEERMGALGAIAAKQEQILQQMGPGNPFVKYGKYAQTLHKFVETAGFRDSTLFFNPLDAEFDVQPPEPKPSPEEILANAQAQKVQIEAQLDQQKAQWTHEENMAKEERERERIQADIYLRAKEIELKYKVELDKAKMKGKSNGGSSN